jgi:deazaflavin-dependent oxidoreductase (nitroreductase family)
MVARPAATGRGQRLAFRTTGRRLGGTLQGVPVGLLTTTGRRSGRVAVSGGGSKLWLGRAPAWFLNLKAHPEAEFRTHVGVERVVGRELTDSERADLWPGLLEEHPVWGAAQASTRTRPCLEERDGLGNDESVCGEALMRRGCGGRPCRCGANGETGTAAQGEGRRK